MAIVAGFDVHRAQITFDALDTESHSQVSLTISRKLARRSFHVLRELGPAALEPVAD